MPGVTPVAADAGARGGRGVAALPAPATGLAQGVAVAALAAVAAGGCAGATDAGTTRVSAVAAMADVEPALAGGATVAADGIARIAIGPATATAVAAVTCQDGAAAGA